MKKVVKLLYSFFSHKFPNLKSQMFVASISNEIFIEKVVIVRKAALIQVSEDLCFVTDFNMSHLFL